MSEPKIIIGGGRHSRARAEAPSRPRTIRLSPLEQRRVEKAARVNGQKFSEFARDALVTAAEDCLEDGQL